MMQERDGAVVQDCSGAVQVHELQSGGNMGCNLEGHTHQVEEASKHEDGKVEEVPSGEVSSQADSMDTNEIEMALKESS
jgi:hypothetical protein